MPETIITRGFLKNYKEWPKFRKTSLTHFKRIDGPFTVQTSEGKLHCEDGYVGVDARGYPYPIAKDEFELIYKLAEDE